MKGFFAALQFLTVARRYQKTPMTPAAIGSGVFYFPLVGLALGLSLAGLNYLLERYLESEILGTVHVMMLIIITGAVHLEELQKSFDRFWQRSHFRRVAESAPTIYGLLAVLLVVLFKIRAIEVIGETRSLTLLIAPMLARWAPLMLVYGLSGESDSARIAERLKSWQFIIITAVTLAAAGYFLGIAGLWVSLCVSLLALFTRLVVARRSDGFVQDDLGSLIELAESLSFVLFASF